jgi:siroheme synthase-like protein
MANLFPVFLKLEGRRCFVVGGGTIAEQKIDGLLESKADLHVVAPTVTDRIRALAAEGRVKWTARAFEPADLDGASLVVAATGDESVNDAVFQSAASRSVMCNAVDEPERCDFYYPAVVRRGDLQIAISTNGRSPALAQRLRRELEEYFAPDYAAWLEWLGKMRTLLFRSAMDPERRREALHQIADRKVYERFRSARQRREGAA